MRITSKILSIVLVLCMLFTTFGYAATYTDVSVDDANYSAISLLSSLGIIQGYPDGSFGGANNVTRAEFTVMLMRTLNLSNLGSSDPAGLPFSDVEPVKDWAVSDIRTAYDLGIINGYEDATFKPNNNVTHEEALKMIVCAMGYEPMAIDIAGGKDKVWPFGYTTVAVQLLLTSGVNAVYTEPAKRVDIVKYIYNALEVDLMRTTEQNGMVRNEIIAGSNILKDKLRVTEGYGELLADTESTALDGGVVARSGEIIILPDGETDYVIFKNPDISTKGLVGRNISYYYKEDASYTKTIVHIDDTTRSTSILKIDPENIDFSGSWSSGVEISYWENEYDRSPTTVTLKSNPEVSVNGRKVDLDLKDPDDIFGNIDSGLIELIDTENTGTYNKVNIESYETYVVNTKTTSPNKMITDMYRTDEKRVLELDDKDSRVTITMKRSTNNTTVAFSSLKKYDVLSVKEVESAGGRITIDVIVSSEKATGTVTSVDYGSNEIIVNDDVYKFSKYIPEEMISSLNVNDTCNFYLDKDNKIATYEKIESENSFYAYICGVAPDVDTTEFKIINNKGTRDITLNSAKRVKIDGEQYSDPEAIAQKLYDIISDNGGNIDGKTLNGSQLVKLTKNGSGDISAIDTIAITEDDDKTNLKLNASVGIDDEYTYNSSNKCFKNGNKEIFIDSNTVIFYVPSDRTNYTSYAKRAVSYFKNNAKYSNFEVYDVGEGSTAKAKCLVFYQAKTQSAEINLRSPLLIINSVSTKVDSSSDSTVSVIGGYIFGEDEENGIEAIEPRSAKNTSTFGNAVVGDVYRIGFDGSYYASNSKPILAFEDDSVNYNGYQEDSPVEILHGLLVSADDNTLKIAVTDDIDDLIADYENSTDESSIEYNTTIKTYTVNSDTIFIENSRSGKDNSNKITVTENNDNLATYTTFENTCKSIIVDEDGNLNTSKVAAAEILIYVIDDEPIFVYKIER